VALNRMGFPSSPIMDTTQRFIAASTSSDPGLAYRLVYHRPRQNAGYRMYFTRPGRTVTAASCSRRSSEASTRACASFCEAGPIGPKFCYP
jgi:hypothetical protein